MKKITKEERKEAIRLLNSISCGSTLSVAQYEEMIEMEKITKKEFSTSTTKLINLRKYD